MVVWLERLVVASVCFLQREQSTRTHAVYRASTSATPLCSTPPPPQQALDNRRATWLAERRTLGGSAGADRGAKQRHDKLATGFHPVGLRMMLESMWPILPPLARAFQCGARSCTQGRASLRPICPIQQSGGRKEPRRRPVCRRKPNSPPTRVALMGRGWPPTRVAGVWEISEFSHGTRRVWSGASREGTGERPFDRLTVLACSGLNRATKH